MDSTNVVFVITEKSIQNSSTFARSVWSQRSLAETEAHRLGGCASSKLLQHDYEIEPYTVKGIETENVTGAIIAPQQKKRVFVLLRLQLADNKIQSVHTNREDAQAECERLAGDLKSKYKIKATVLNEPDGIIEGEEVSVNDSK